MWRAPMQTRCAAVSLPWPGSRNDWDRCGIDDDPQVAARTQQLVQGHEQPGQRNLRAWQAALPRRRSRRRPRPWQFESTTSARNHEEAPFSFQIAKFIWLTNGFLAQFGTADSCSYGCLFGSGCFCPGQLAASDRKSDRQVRSLSRNPSAAAGRFHRPGAGIQVRCSAPKRWLGTSHRRDPAAPGLRRRGPRSGRQ